MLDAEKDPFWLAAIDKMNRLWNGIRWMSGAEWASAKLFKRRRRLNAEVAARFEEFRASRTA